MLLDMNPTELTELTEYVQVLLGGEDVDVDITEKEVRVLGKRSLKDYVAEINNWQVKQQFSNILGTKTAQVDLTNKFIFDNTLVAQRLSDWFSSMSRVGGNIRWKRDYVELIYGQQTYDLCLESGVPYSRGDRKIHKVMWYASPEIFGNNNLTPDLVDNSLFNFGTNGLSYGSNTLGYLGNLFDVVLLAQGLEQRNKIIRSEFFYNISGDLLEITPTPGSAALDIGSGPSTYATTSTTSLVVSVGTKSLVVGLGLPYTVGMLVTINNTSGASMYGSVTSYDTLTGALVVEITSVVGSGTFAQWSVSRRGATGAKVFYYYFDTADFTDISAQDGDPNELITNPMQIKISNVPYSKLNSIARTFIDNYTVALAKYVQAAKWRRVREIASPEQEYKVEFDYSSLLSESENEKAALLEDLRKKLEEIDMAKLMEDKVNIAKAQAYLNGMGGRRFLLG